MEECDRRYLASVTRARFFFHVMAKTTRKTRRSDCFSYFCCLNYTLLGGISGKAKHIISSLSYNREYTPWFSLIIGTSNWRGLAYDDPGS